MPKKFLAKCGCHQLLYISFSSGFLECKMLEKKNMAVFLRQMTPLQWGQAAPKPHQIAAKGWTPGNLKNYQLFPKEERWSRSDITDISKLIDVIFCP